MRIWSCRPGAPRDKSGITCGGADRREGRDATKLSNALKLKL